MYGWLKTGSAIMIILLLMSAKKLLTAQKIAQQIESLTKFADNVQKFAQ
jgi:hypothetical protein